MATLAPAPSLCACARTSRCHRLRIPARSKAAGRTSRTRCQHRSDLPHEAPAAPPAPACQAPACGHRSACHRPPCRGHTASRLKQQAGRLLARVLPVGLNAEPHAHHRMARTPPHRTFPAARCMAMPPARSTATGSCSVLRTSAARLAQACCHGRMKHAAPGHSSALAPPGSRCRTSSPPCRPPRTGVFLRHRHIAMELGPLAPSFKAAGQAGWCHELKWASDVGQGKANWAIRTWLRNRVEKREEGWSG